MKPQTKKRLAAACAAMLSLSMLAACTDTGESAGTASAASDTASATGEPVTITYSQFSAGDTNIDTLEAMIAAFEEDNPDVKVELQTTGYDDYFTALATKMAGNGAPDCFELNLENFLSYAIRDSIEPLDEYFDRLGASKDDYATGPLNAATYDGKVYGIPQTYSTVVLFYNKDLFDQAGVSYPTEDWTWEDETEAAEKIRALGDDIWGMYQPVTYNELYKAVQQNGGSLVSDDGTEFTMNSPENVETLSMMLSRACGDNRVMPNTVDLAGRGDSDLFKEGKLGMLLTGIWMFDDFSQNIQDFNWDIAVEPGNTQKATHLFSNMAAINKNIDQEKKDAAFRFLNYMATNEKCVKLRVDASWELPVVADEAELAPYLEQTPPDNRQAVMDSMEYSVAPPALIEYGAVVDTMTPILDDAVLNNRPAQETLDEIQEQLTSKNLMNPKS